MLIPRIQIFFIDILRTAPTQLDIVYYLMLFLLGVLFQVDVVKSCSLPKVTMYTLLSWKLTYPFTRPLNTSLNKYYPVERKAPSQNWTTTSRRIKPAATAVKWPKSKTPFPPPHPKLKIKLRLNYLFCFNNTRNLSFSAANLEVFFEGEPFNVRLFNFVLSSLLACTMLSWVVWGSGS